MSRILTVDDEVKMTRLLEINLKNEGHQVDKATSAREALQMMEETIYDIVITDLKMPGMDGMGLLKKIKDIYPYTQVIVITAFGTVESAVEAMKSGAFHYLTKPLNLEELKEVVKKALHMKNLEEENITLKEKILQGEIVGESNSLKRAMQLVKKVSPQNTTILIWGETGTGKELVARAVHKLSPRRNGPYIVVNCAAIPENLLESELFGHKKGTFTGALQDKKGKIELAEHGTLFLDEIGSLSLSLQSKLLRFLETKEIEPLGSNRVIKVDVRVVAATNQDLKQSVQEGTFREDLYFRLHVFPIHLPPLRERKEDIPLLINHFIKVYSQKLNKKVAGIEPDALQLLMQYNWPGNVRELENLVERAMVLCEGKMLKKEYFHIPIPAHLPSFSSYQEGKNKILEEFEKNYFASLLEKFGGNVSKTAQEAGIDRKNLYLKLKKYRLYPENFRRRNTTNVEK
ncbi:MAG: sigma-54-dependent Fis family transcriptional regulator [Caldiserica bacterium]|nr:sigma-54-dependent Fis family transcriptional regulator [Caldisericota bacterium]